MTVLVDPRQTNFELKYLVAQSAKIEPRKIQTYSAKLAADLCFDDSQLVQYINDANHVVTAEYQVHRERFTDEVKSCAAMKYLVEPESTSSSSSSSIYDLLLQNCDKASSECARVIWSCLDYLPTYKPFIDRVKAADYTTTFDSPNRAVVAYSLEICNNILQANPDDFIAGYDLSIDKRKLILKNFIEKQGFTKILDIVLHTEANSDFINFKILSVCINLLSYFIKRLKTPLEAWDEQLKILISPDNRYASAVSEKLLLLAGINSEAKDITFMENALDVISSILSFIDITPTIVKFPQAKSLLQKVFNSSSSKSRELASSFAIKIGKAQIVIIDWLLESINLLEYSKCDAALEMFSALNELFKIWSLSQTSKKENIDGVFARVAALFSDKLTAVCELRPSQCGIYLTSLLESINQLINCDVNYLNGTALRENLHVTLYDRLLFPFQARFTAEFSPLNAESAKFDNENDGLCDNLQVRCATFTVLASYCGSNPVAMEYVISQIGQLNEFYSRNGVSEQWNVSLSREMRQPGIKYVGLKNQGLTCYMNSLLQQIFMNVDMRETILKTPLPSYHRASFRKLEDMVGRHYFMPNGTRLYVKNYNPASKSFLVDQESKGKPVEEKTVNSIMLSNRSLFKEVPPADAKPVTEADEKAIKIFDELQRVFCYLKYSNKRFYDPRQFVEACKTLNMNYDVYSQNDSTEFYAQVLDRMETAMKGSYTGVNMWDKIKQNLQGSMAYTKTPKECEIYAIDKKNCGHVKGAREQGFTSIELSIRGKESIEEALMDMMKGELMDGDNKIKCEDCNKYVATVRNTSIGALPKH